jgi:hypothetical protein
MSATSEATIALSMHFAQTQMDRSRALALLVMMEMVPLVTVCDLIFHGTVFQLLNVSIKMKDA